MENPIEYEGILGKTADELFVAYPVEDLGQLINKLSVDVAEKKQRLKVLVGNKYRDLLNVADDIIKMNEITTVENEELMHLAFKRSDYNSKALLNLSKFNNTMHHYEIEKAQNSNRPNIMKNVVHDLNYSLLTFKHQLNDELNGPANTTSFEPESSKLMSDDLDEVLDDYQPISAGVSNNFVIISKTIFLVHHYFKDELSNTRKTFSTLKYKQLCSEFTDLLESSIIKLKHESDCELVSQLALSYLIANQSNPTDTIKWMTNQRLHYFQKMVATKATFQELLNYIYITIEYMSILKSRIPILINRAKNNTGSSNWIQQTCFKKWIKWLKQASSSDSFDSEGDIDVQYNFNLGSLTVDSAGINCIIAEWKVKAAEFLLINFTDRFDKASANLTDLVVLLKYVLVSFKHFTSLVELPVGDDTIIQFIIKKWSTSYLSQLSIELNEFGNIKELVISTFNDEAKILSITLNSQERQLYDFDNDFTIESVLQMSKENSNQDPVLNLLHIFKEDLRSIINSIESLQSLTFLIKKPVISIDDTEDEDFWSTVSNNLKDFLNDCVTKSVSILNDSIKQFFANISECLESKTKKVSNIQLLYLIRILVHLENNIQLEEIYATFDKYLQTELDRSISLESLVEPLLEKSFDIIVTSVYDESYKEQFKRILDQRFSEDHEYPEMMLWETMPDDKQIPTVCSIEYCKTILGYIQQLMYVEDMNYSNIYSLISFDTARQKIINILLQNIVDKLDELDDTVKSPQLLLTYADYLFTLQLKQDSSNTADPEISSKFTKLYPELADGEYNKQIQSAISENYKNQYLIFYPLTK